MLVMSDTTPFLTYIVGYLIGGGIFFAVLFFVVRAAVTEGLKYYVYWRERTGRDTPPSDRR